MDGMPDHPSKQGMALFCFVPGLPAVPVPSHGVMGTGGAPHGAVAEVIALGYRKRPAGFVMSERPVAGRDEAGPTSADDPFG